MWRSLVARVVRDDEVAGSNPVTPTSTKNGSDQRKRGQGRLLFRSSGHNWGTTAPVVDTDGPATFQFNDGGPTALDSFQAR